MNILLQLYSIVHVLDVVVNQQPVGNDLTFDPPVVDIGHKLWIDWMCRDDEIGISYGWYRRNTGLGPPLIPLVICCRHFGSFGAFLVPLLPQYNMWQVV